VVGLYDRREELFMMGMFSMLDGILDRSLPDILKEIPLAEDIKGALTGTENKLHDVYKYILAYEDGNWHRTWTYAAKLATDEAFLPQFYLDSVNWVEQNFRETPHASSQN
jgi:EAL and modified HD-GYP domain-containing signal transduction protein